MRTIKNVLIVHPYGIGDLLFATPIMRALRLVPTVRRVDLLLGSRTKEMIETNPHVNKVFVVDRDEWRASGKWSGFNRAIELGNELRKREYDLLIDFSLRREYAFFSQFFLNIPHRLGLDYKGRACFHNHKQAIPDGFVDKHVVDYYSDLVDTWGIPVQHRQMELHLEEGALREASDFLSSEGIESNERILVVAPGGGESWGKDAHLKRWPIERMAAFANRLYEEAKFNRIIIVGSPAEKELAEKLSEQLQGKVVLGIGKISFKAAAALIKKSHCFVGNDGGLVHIAHALRVPLIGIYGPASPNVYGPYPRTDRTLPIYKPDVSCRPCYHRFRYHQDCKSMEETTVEYAWGLVEEKKFLSVIDHYAESQLEGFYNEVS